MSIVLTYFYKIKSNLILVFLLLLSFYSIGQNSTIQHAIRLYNRGLYFEAIPKFKSALTYEPNSPLVNYKIGASYLNLNNYDSALIYFNKVHINYDNDTSFVKMYLYTLKATGNIQQELSLLENYKKIFPYNASIKLIGLSLNLPIHIEENNTKYKVKNSLLSSTYREFSPRIYDSVLIYVSNKPSPKKGFRNFIYKKNSASNPFSKVSLYSIDTNYTKSNDSIAIHKPKIWLNGKKNIGPFVISKNDYLYYTTNNSSYKGTSTLGIRFSKVEDGKILKSSPFQYNKKTFSVEHPSISESGKYLYFVSDNPAGYGGFDIYMSTLVDSSLQKWSTPVILNNFVNTPGNEGFPYVMGDSILYFSSDYLPGYGALDLFKVKLKNGLPIDSAYNLGASINSKNDDFGICFKNNGIEGYFSSNRINNNDNIYLFESFTDKPIQSDTVTIVPSYSNKIDSGVNFQQQSAQLKKDALKELLKSTLFEIHYDFDKYSINANGKIVLDTLSKILSNYPDLYMVIGSFTDKIGPKKYNLKLSLKRSSSVMMYLKKLGVNPLQIASIKNYGNQYLIPKSHGNSKSNRRTEIYLTNDKSNNWTKLHKDTSLQKELRKFVHSKTSRKILPPNNK